jgi:uncharacterized protein YegP (UPF0339 family)
VIRGKESVPHGPVPPETGEPFVFNLKASNGLTILTSEGYADKSSAVKGVESVRKNAAKDANFDQHRKTRRPDRQSIARITGVTHIDFIYGSDPREVRAAAV